MSDRLSSKCIRRLCHPKTTTYFIETIADEARHTYFAGTLIEDGWAELESPAAKDFVCGSGRQ
jgi:hypothetical protein